MEFEQFKTFAQVFGVRRNRKQKDRFLENLKGVFGSYGYTMTIYEDKMGLHKIKHALFGDLKNANEIYVVGYDTTENNVVGNGKYWPINENRNRSSVFVNLTINLILSIVMAVVGVYFIALGISKEKIEKILWIILGVITLFITNKVSQGRTNRSTFAKTSSIFLVFEILKKTKKKNIAFMFLDNGSFSKIGINFLKKDNLIRDDQRIIYLDCFSDGDRLLICSDKLAKDKAMNLHKMYQGEKVYVNLDECESNKFEDMNNIVILCNVYEENDGSFAVHNVKTDDDLTIDGETIDKVVEMLA
jgi:hypothetical protein